MQILSRAIMLCVAVLAASPSIAQVPDANGVYTWHVIDRDGADRAFSFTPTLIEPEVEVTMSQEASGIRFVYRVANRAIAKHAIATCQLDLTLPVSVDGEPIPPGWMRLATPGNPRVTWGNVDPSKAIAPGGSIGALALRSMNWPGPAIFRCFGLHPPYEEPPWLPRNVLAELYAIRKNDTREASTLGPAITVTAETPMVVLLATVVRAYRGPLAASEDPFKSELIASLDQLRAVGTESNAQDRTRVAIRALQANLARPRTITTSRDLLLGLGICLTNLESLLRDTVKR